MLEPIRKNIISKSSATNNAIELYGQLRNIIFNTVSIHTQLKITKDNKPKLVCSVKSAVEASELRLHEDIVIKDINAFLAQVSQAKVYTLVIKIKD